MASRAEVEEAAKARSMMRRRVMSIVEDQGEYSSSCGYCKSSSKSSVAQGLWAHTLTVDDYQGLLNRGWRRSGMFLYKPNMKRTCCPPHSIRLDVSAFVISKEQARVMRRMQRYLEGSYHGNRQDSGPSDTPKKELLGEGKKTCIPHETPELDPPGTAKKKKTLEAELATCIHTAITRCVQSGSLPRELSPLPQARVQKVTEKMRGKLKGLEGQLEYTSSVAFAVAGAQKKKGLKELELSSALVAEMLVSQLKESDGCCGYIPQACSGHLNFLTRVESTPPSSGTDTPPTTEGAPRTEESQDTSNSQGRGLKRSPLPHGNDERELPPVKPRHLKVQIKQSSFDLEEFALYKKYQVRILCRPDAKNVVLACKLRQIAVHNDKPEEVKESSYTRFLVDSPLIHVPPESDGSTPASGFGSFHQQYRIDDRLVAVGVVDVLPNCLSSKYLFWDPDLAFLSLGKYSAMQEIQWVQEANRVCPSLTHYYLGFYIHTCPKMRYKAAYAPSELLCPSKYIWVPYEQTKPALATSQYLCLSECPVQNGAPPKTETSEKPQQKKKTGNMEDNNSDEGMNGDALIFDAECLASHVEQPLNMENGLVSSEKKEEKQEDLSEDLGKIVMLLNNKCLTFKRLEELRVVPPVHMASLAEELTLYMQGVGPELASRMAFVPRC